MGMGERMNEMSISIPHSHKPNASFRFMMAILWTISINPNEIKRLNAHLS